MRTIVGIGVCARVLACARVLSEYSECVRVLSECSHARGSSLSTRGSSDARGSSLITLSV